MARYCDGRAARVKFIPVEPTADGLHSNGEVLPWTALARADDGGGDVILKPTPDTGERFLLNALECEAIAAFAPDLVGKAGLKRESARLVLGLAGVAAGLAALLLIGAPMQAEAIAKVMPERYREHLADIGWSQVDAFSDRCEIIGKPGWDALKDMFGRLRRHARNTKGVRLELVNASIPNAFTLPDDTIVLTTGMLALAGSPDEIAGVLAHELGHVEARHVLTNLVRQMSLGLFIDVVFGGSGAAQAAAAVNVVALRFSRQDETEADKIGLRIMDIADINPGAMATLFRRIAAEEKKSSSSIPELLRSHPDSAARAEAAERLDRRDRQPALNAADWNEVRSLCEEEK
jgi:beta-barrel assembly-enhancing protease